MSEQQQQQKTDEEPLRAVVAKAGDNTGTSVAPSAPPPLTFEALSETVHVYSPPAGSKSLAAQASRQAGQNGVLQPFRLAPQSTPRVVLIMGWMNAPLRIVTKYAAPYALLFPAATIIVKLSTGISFMRSRQAQLEALEDVARLVCEAEASNGARTALRTQMAQLEGSAKQAGLTMDVDTQNALQTKVDKGEPVKAPKESVGETVAAGGMVVHSFSDGGAYNISQLLRLLHGRSALAPMAHIMDSSPGQASPRSGSTAMTMSLAHRPFARTIVRTGMYIYLFVLYALRRVTGRKSWSQIMRQRLNMPSVWSWKAADGDERKLTTLPPRLYLYSKTDALIDYRAVEEHARLAARANGQQTASSIEELEKVENSAGVVAKKRWDSGVQHCDIGRSDFDGYWRTVRTFLSAVL